MNRTPMQPPWALLGLAGALGLALVVGSRLTSGIPEVGPLAPIVAAPAELREEFRLGSGGTFGEVLQAASVGWSEQNALLLAFREQANPRRMKEDTRITLRWLPGQEELRGVDVSLNKDETVRLIRDEAGWSSVLIQTPIWVDTLYVSGAVQDALYNAVLQNAGISNLPEGNRAWFVTMLDQVFQWQLDFSRQVRTGDAYRFVVEREVRPDGTMKGGHLLAAEYVNQGTAYRAIWFDPNDDGQGTFYDEEGKSVRRAFLTRPITLSRISSRFNPARLHPVLNTVRAHRGVDFAAAIGTPLMATGDGVVIFAGRKGDLGNLIEIRHPNGWVTRYGHLNGFAPGIRVGTRVRQGETIGYVGRTGMVTGPHLHYEMRRGNEALDPLAVQLPPGDPVPNGARGRWGVESRDRLMLLQTLPGPSIPLAHADPEPGAGYELGGGEGD